MLPGFSFKQNLPQTSILKILLLSTSIHHPFNSSLAVMPLPNILRKQTPVVVSLLRRSIEPHVLIAGSNRRTFANSFYRRNSTPIDSPPAPNLPESEPLPLLSDVTSAFDETPEAPRPDREQSSTPPEEAAGEREGDAYSGDRNTGSGLRKVFIEHGPRKSIFRPVFSDSPPTVRRIYPPLSEPPAEQERRVSDSAVRRVACEGSVVLSRVHRIPVSMIEGDVDPTRANLDGLLMKIQGPVSYLVYISPEYVVEEWNFWKHEDKQPVKGGSPLTRDLGIKMSKPTAREIHNYWFAQKSLGGQPTLELEFIQALVRKTRRSYMKDSTVLKDTAEFSRYSRNVRRIIESPEDEGIKFETWRGSDSVLSRMDALTEVTRMGQKVIFQLEKYFDYLTGRGVDDKSGASGETGGFASFMLRNALLCSDRTDFNIKTFLNTPKDRDIVEYSALRGTYHLPRLQVLVKISQSFGSFLGLADLGVTHLLRQKCNQSELAMEAHEKLLDRISRNVESLTSTPIGGNGEGLEVPFYGRDRYTTRRYTRVRVIDGIIQQQQRAILLVMGCLGLRPLKRKNIRKIGLRTPPMYPFPAQRSVRLGDIRRYSTVAPRPSSYMPDVPMGPPQISKTKTGSIRERFEAVETLQRNVLNGIGLNPVLKDLSPEVVPSVDSTDDTLGYNWEGLGDMSDFLDASAAKPLEIGDLSEVR